MSSLQGVREVIETPGALQFPLYRPGLALLVHR